MDLVGKFFVNKINIVFISEKNYVANALNEY